MKYTKTATFLFPLLNVPKSLFDCYILDSWGRVKYKTRFLNCFLKNLTIGKYQKDNYLHILVRNYRDTDFDKFYSTIQAFPNYIDDYDLDNCIVFIFDVPSDFKIDFHALIEGYYSEISIDSKRLILANNFFSGKVYTLPLILNKALVLKESWEERLSNPGSEANLREQEVWPIMEIKNEILTTKIVSSIIENKNKKLTASRDFDI